MNCPGLASNRCCGSIGSFVRFCGGRVCSLFCIVVVVGRCGHAFSRKAKLFTEHKVSVGFVDLVLVLIGWREYRVGQEPQIMAFPHADAVDFVVSVGEKLNGARPIAVAFLLPSTESVVTEILLR